MHEYFIDNGFDDFLAKPIELGMLSGALERWIPNYKKNYSSDMV
jgi:hypothetical protein